MSLAREIRGRYLKAQKSLVEAKELDERSVLLSFPLHYSGYTRVEFAVTRINATTYMLSDFAQTLGELRDSGYSVTTKLRERILEITKLWRMSLSGENLMRQCSDDELGHAIHDFAEAVKTIGDCYLAYPSRLAHNDDDEEVKRKIRKTLDDRHLEYGEGLRVPGKIEEHRVDFYVPPNGLPGLAVAVLSNPDRLHAEAWGFKAHDIKAAAAEDAGQRSILIGLVYDASVTKDMSRNIIDRVADISLPSADLDYFGQRLDALRLYPGTSLMSIL